ncbi:MAG TPA: hypothetical protein VJI97_00550 [Candidatus Nanoarchaeia archaeon]|nr:hypothetical protein [Candidatus Nanoarchaeia archaeon]
MEAIFALNGLGYLLVSIISFVVCYLMHKKGPDECRIGKIAGIIGIFFLLMSLLNLSWVFGYLEPDEKDFIFVNVIITVVSSFLLAYAAYGITRNKNMLYILILFITTIFAVNFSIQNFFVVTLGASYALMAITSFELAFLHNSGVKKSGYAGFFHVGISGILLMLYIAGNNQTSLPWFIQSAAMIFILWFLQHSSILPFAGKTKDIFRGGIVEYVGALFKFLFFIGMMGSFVFISTIAVHELGHALTAQYYGCQQFKAVIYDIVSPHTEISCSAAYNNIAITLAGFAATLAVGLIFMATGSGLARGMSYLIIGFGILASYGDLTDINVSKNLVTLLMLLGLIISILAVASISFFYLGQPDMFGKVTETHKFYTGRGSLKRKKFKHEQAE